MSDKKIPFSRALLWILGSTLLISGSAFMGWLYLLHVKKERLQDDQYRIVAVIQSTLQADALKTAYLAELLNLSFDRPANLYQFDSNEGVRTLLNHPLIKEADIKKILPGTLLIQYQMRSPIAYLGEYANTVMDQEGNLFPFHPFFTPKRLPVLYLGIEKEKCKWGSCLKGEISLTRALEIIHQFDLVKQDKFRMKQLDVSLAESDSYGQRQVVVVLEENCHDLSPSQTTQSLIYLRLNVDDTIQGLANFFRLQSVLFEKKEDPFVKEKMIIDLRIPHLAFIKR